MTKATFAHVGITCDDPHKIERFYTKYFGFRRARVIPLGDTEIVFIKSDSLYLELFKAKEPRPIPAPLQDGYPFQGLRHLAFSVPNVEEKIKEMGDDVKVMLGPAKFDDWLKGWAGAWVSDPEGNIIELSQGYVDEAIPTPLA